MQYIGQTHIVRQLDFIIPELIAGESASILLRGPSGFGKTHMALAIANEISGSSFEFRMGDSFLFNTAIRTHIYDEIHLSPSIELFYPMMGSEGHVIIFTTNVDADLPEAFINRCYDFTFTDYSVEELKTMVRSKTSLVMLDDQLEYMIESGNKNPRIILSLVKRLSMWQKRNTLVTNLSITQFKEVINYVFGIRDGMDIMCRRYLRTLHGLGGTASLAVIKAALHIDEGTIRYQIEPILLYKNLLKISSRGRSLIYGRA